MSVINTNIKALAAQDSSRIAENKLTTAMERLSTGLRINSAKDDAAGLAIASRMTAQVRGYSMAIRNANDGISMTQTAEGAIGQVAGMLQRMRELAVQASSGTLTSSDRASLQLEVDQLKTEIDNVAAKTTFNTIKLLDGTAKNVNLQTGVNAGEKITIGFESVNTKDIGVGQQAALSSQGGLFVSGGKFDAFTSGALLLNGVAVGASLSTDDVASSSNGAASAIAKAAAINRVAAQSGVYASVGTTTVGGTLMALPAAASSETITINGVATASITSSATDTSVTRSRVVAAINAVTNQTGVVAIDSQDDNQGVVLKAADGRNVVISTTFAAASTTGISAAGTYVGSYDLFTKDGSAFNIEQAYGADLRTTGLHQGTYQQGVAQTVSYTRASTAAGTAPSSSTTGVLNGNTLLINDVQIAAAVAGDDTSSISTTASTKAASAIAIAAAINKKAGVTGVHATANANEIIGAGFSAGTSGTIYLNGTSISVNTISRANVLQAINSQAIVTGVSAKENGDGIKLIAADGRNILIATDLGITAGNIGLSGVTIGASATAGTAATAGQAVAFYSTVSLTSDKAFRVQSGSEGNTNFNLLGFRTGTFGGENNGTKVAELDISTSDGASKAVSVIDAALDKVLQNQSKAGAFNNRLDEVVNNLTVMNENITASRSRIQDTDYATETTNLAKNQIIQQAATAMLAQANQSAQTVLALLK